MATRRRPSRARKQMSDASIDFTVDMEQLIGMLAAADALTSSVTKSSRYMDALIDAAFERVDDDFNATTAVYGQISNDIKHMFEWGTTGINTGRTNVRLNPNSPQARLWINYNSGFGLERKITLAFKPSVANVPKPTVKDTGMSSDVIRRMNTHVFRWKSQVIELGQEVTIAPRKAKFLLFPNYGKKNHESWRPNDIKRGYVLRQFPVTVMPGRKYRGKFTTHWFKFWNGTGPDSAAEQFDRILDEYIKTDFTPKIIQNRSARSSRPIGENINARIKKKSKQIQKEVASKARGRQQ